MINLLQTTAKLLLCSFFLLCLPCSVGASISPVQDSLRLSDSLRKAKILFERNRLQESVELLQLIRRDALNLDSRYFLAQADFRMGLIYIKMEDPARALECLGRAYELYKEDDQEEPLVYCISNMAIAYAQMKDYPSSIKQFKELCGLYLGMGDSLNYAKSMINLSHVYGLAGDWRNALACTDSILEFRVVSDELLSDFCFRRGVAYMRLGNIDEAERLFDTVVSKVSGSGLESLEIRSLVLECMAEIHQLQGQKDLALQEYRELVLMRDSLGQVKHNKAIYELENQFELDRKDHDLALARQKHQIMEQRVWMVVLVLLSILFLFLVILFRYRSRHYRSVAENMMLNAKVEKDREVLSRLDIHGKEAVHLLQRLQQNIVELRKNRALDGEDYFALNNTLDQIQHQMETWAFLVDGENSDLMLKLEQKYPSLTQVERKTCMLLYIDFSTKDIALSFNISEKSVNNTRSRIRKKLQVPPEMSLTDFLRKENSQATLLPPVQ